MDTIEGGHESSNISFAARQKMRVGSSSRKGRTSGTHGEASQSGAI
jgi:hypothetical protein